MRKARVLAEIKTSTEISLVIKINIRVIRFRLGQSVSLWFSTLTSILPNFRRQQIRYENSCELFTVIGYRR